MFKFLTIMMLLFLASCEEQGFKTSKKFIDGSVVDAETLNLGRQVYFEYCMACHGITGEGNGPAAKGSNPPPRNFTQGLYKFGLVKNSALPTDDDFHRIIKHGLKGTGMLAWDVSDQQIFAVTQFIKTFAPQVWEKGDKSSLVEKISLSADPYGIARESSAIERGKEVYHFVANCQACHRAYLSKDEMVAMNKKVNGTDLKEVDPTMYDIKIQESEYYLHDNKEVKAKYLPPDFTWSEVRSASTVEEIAQRLCAGVTGTGMPAWCGAISDEDLWSVAYYVKSLMNIKGDFEKRRMLYPFPK